MQSSLPFHSASLTRALLLGASLMLCGAPAPAQSTSASALSAAQDQVQATSAVKRDFAQFVQHHLQAPGGGLPNGFPLELNDLQDLKDAKIGYGFQVYTIDPKDIVGGRGDLSGMVKATGVWRFLITLNERPIGLATVERVGGKWEAVAYGGAILAKDVDALMGFHGNAERSNLRFIRVFQAQSDFLEVVSSGDGKARFAPLYSARLSLLLRQRAAKTNPGAVADDLIEPAELLEPLRVAVKTNMDNFR